jgi:hypothetical protein
MINNHGVVHWIDILLPIKPNFIDPIILKFAYLDEHAINEHNITLKF